MADLSVRRISRRYGEELDRESDRMLGAAGDRSEETLSRAEQRLRLPAYMAQPKPVHLAIMRAVDGLLTMGLDHDQVVAAPVPLRAMVRGMRRLEPMMLEQLSQQPEAECIKIMRALATGITRLADEVDPERHAAPAQPDQSPAA